MLCRATCGTVTALVTVFAVVDVSAGRYRIAAILGVFALLNFVVLCVYSRFRHLEAFSLFLIVSCGALCLYLGATGGTENSGILWFACYPVLMFSMLKVRIAIVASFIMLLSISLIFFIPGNPLYKATYPEFTKIIGIASFMLIGGFTSFQAYSREQSALAVSRLNSELSHIASTDEVTQLPNRRDLSLRLEFECKRAKRTSDEFSILLCDIDYFKRINDNFGHVTGDIALQAFSRLLESRFRDTDSVGRWGGEEFLAILPATNLAQAIALADDVRKCICRASLLPNMPNRLVTVSIGVASSVEKSDATELVSLADSRLYQAKERGRNRVMPEPSSIV